MKRGIVLCTVLLLSAAMKKDIALFLSPKGWPAPRYDFSENPLTDAGVHLGRQLFFDPLLSADGSISCASCHSPYSAFAHNDHALSHGIHDSIGKRNAPALFNLAWRSTFMWDGAINHLDVQALAPISHPVEMGSDIGKVVGKLSQSERYRHLFKAAFGDSTVTGERTLKAISQFLLTLVSSSSEYDSVRYGMKDFSPQEEKGYALFQANCNSCHTEPLFMRNEFTSDGITPTDDEGRSSVTSNHEDAQHFQIPSLRNLSFTAPYMHDGRYKRLQDVINHYSDDDYRNNPADQRLGSIIRLNAAQKIDLLAFLLTLNDKKFIFQPDHLDPTNYSYDSKK
jgi:cytochrome c peroxidase